MSTTTSPLQNTFSVTSGTLQIFYWNELQTPTAYALAAAVDSEASTITLNHIAGFSPFIGQIIAIDQELMSVETAAAGSYGVIRAALGSQAAAHAAGAAILHLSQRTIELSFAPGFFENRASNNYSYSVNIPDIRVLASQLFVTNSFGNSEASNVCYATGGNWLRTLSGGSYVLQVNGYMATQTTAAPPLTIAASHAVRDVRMQLGTPPSGYTVSVDVLMNGSPYVSLSYDPAANPPTQVIDGTNLPPLTEEASLNLNIVVTPIAGSTAAPNPGADLTVTIRM